MGSIRSIVVLTAWLVGLGALAIACRDRPAGSLRMEATGTWGVVVLRPGPPAAGQTGWALEWRRGDEPWALLDAAIPTTWEGIQVLLEGQPEQTTYQFRVQPFGSDWRGPMSNVVSHRLGVHPPLAVQVGTYYDWRGELAALRVEWSRGSRVATRERLERALLGPDGRPGPWSPVDVPAGAETADDRDLTTWIDGARYQYRVASDAAGELSAWHVSAPTSEAPIPAPAPWENGWQGGLFVPAGADWSVGSFESPVEFFQPLILRAADDVIHALGSESSGRVVHLWHDASGFQREVVAEGTAAYLSVAGLTADGRPITAWRANPGIPDARPTLAVRGGGGWTQEPLPAAAIGRPVAIAAEPSGAIQVLLSPAYGATCTLATSAVDGGWTTLETPILAGGAPVHLLSPGDGASILIEEEVLPNGDRVTWLAERDAGGWTAPVRIGDGPAAAAALSPDRRRLAVVTGSLTPALHLRDADGWTMTPLLEGDVTGHATGFDASGEAWVLSGLGYGGGARVLYEERAGP